MQELHKILSTNTKANSVFYEALLPTCITTNLNPKFNIRPYQKEAFGRFDFYWHNGLKNAHQPTHLLYHMATGSGKTLVMAGLIIYLYQQGYRNFLFFVNSTNIIDKTRDNFLNQASSKYLFANDIVIDNKPVSIKEVTNFQVVNDTDINIVFSTIQGLHSSLNNPKENSLTFDDFEDTKLVLISDEAHHINATTKKGLAIDNAEKDALISWEKTVNNIVQANSSNVLLEFTATADITNTEITKKYADKLIYNYSLQQFRQDGYSKEVSVLQADLPTFDRVLQAVIISQYRRKLFAQYQQNIKPVMLFKSKTIKESEAFYQSFLSSIQQLHAADLEKLQPKKTNHILWQAYQYFASKKISLQNLVIELQTDFSNDKLLSVNSKNDSEQKQLAVNSLEDDTNNYRAIFAVDKLNEGWDVLNLFDIVKLYETNDAKQHKPGKTTVSEAQLIGRGARYCPFKLPNKPTHFTRQFDDTTNHELRICETLLYHSTYNPAYIAALHTSLVDIGIVTDKKTDTQFSKPVPKLQQPSITNATDLRQQLNSTVFKVSLQTGYTEQLSAFKLVNNQVQKTISHRLYLKDFGEPIIRKAINQLPFYQFDLLHKQLPYINSINDFIATYLSQIEVSITGLQTKTANLSADEKLAVCRDILEQVRKIIY